MITDKEAEEEPILPRTEAKEIRRIQAEGQASLTEGAAPISKGVGKREEEGRSMELRRFCWLLFSLLPPLSVLWLLLSILGVIRRRRQM
ncbi:hypothetical protein LAD12857_43100 [Lacrimispora amygdalina]|uniref:Uncharacterized protein n=1 Tax=Lacrimispora amygdalina TaxID=253257 RepID=A0ABQ5MC11_9FIRM